LDSYGEETHENPKGLLERVVHRFNHDFQKLLLFYEQKSLRHCEPGRTAVFILSGIVLLISGIFPLLAGRISANGSRTICNQSENAHGTRLEISDKYVAEWNGKFVRHPEKRFGHDRVKHRHHSRLVSDLTQQFSNAHRVVQVSLKEEHGVGSLRIHGASAAEAGRGPAEVSAYFQRAACGLCGESGIAGTLDSR